MPDVSPRHLLLDWSPHPPVSQEHPQQEKVALPTAQPVFRACISVQRYKGQGPSTQFKTALLSPSSFRDPGMRLCWDGAQPSFSLYLPNLLPSLSQGVGPKSTAQYPHTWEPPCLGMQPATSSKIIRLQHKQTVKQRQKAYRRKTKSSA